MSETAIVTLAGHVITALPALIALLYVRSLKVHINQRMDEFIALVRKDARAEGVKEGEAGRVDRQRPE